MWAIKDKGSWRRCEDNRQGQLWSSICCLECRRRNGVVVRRKETRRTPGLHSLYLHPYVHHFHPALILVGQTLSLLVEVISTLDERWCSVLNPSFIQHSYLGIVNQMIWWRLMTMAFLLIRWMWREEIIANEHTSHPFNIKTRPLIKLLLIYLK